MTTATLTKPATPDTTTRPTNTGWAVVEDVQVVFDGVTRQAELRLWAHGEPTISDVIGDDVLAGELRTELMQSSPFTEWASLTREFNSITGRLDAATQEQERLGESGKATVEALDNVAGKIHVLGRKRSDTWRAVLAARDRAQVEVGAAATRIASRYTEEAVDVDSILKELAARIGVLLDRLIEATADKFDNVGVNDRMEQRLRDLGRAVLQELTPAGSP